MSFKKKGKNQEIDARTVEDFISKLGPETQKFLQESSDGEGKSTAAKMKTTAHLGPNFGKPGYISPTKKQNQGPRKPDSPSKRAKPESPVKRASPTRAPPEERTLATTTKKMQLPLVTSKKRSSGEKDDLSDSDPFYREFKVRAMRVLRNRDTQQTVDI